MLDHAYAVVLAGGKGERFWPLSTSRHPKQFLSLVGQKPLLAQSVDRLRGLVPPERVYVITNADSAAAARAAAPKVPRANIIGEPVGRDTAAAVALGAALVRRRDPHGIIAVLTADHIIRDLSKFRAVLGDGLRLAAREDVLLTIGIPPSFPSTGYGYIEAGNVRTRTPGRTRFRVAKRFVEKPDARTAKKYIASGRYYWNSGMFIWSADSILAALGKYRPTLLKMADRLVPTIGTSRFAAALRREYKRLEKISIDYAVMERADNVLVAPATFDWDDVGSWTALERHFRADRDGDVLVGQVAKVDSAGNIVFSEGRLTALVGVRDMVVVQADGVTLVCPKSRAQDVKKLVKKLRDETRYVDLL
ncbi:MAG: mannose-1-phosphate guanylyltransferase [Kiritimatiellae bacterium]|nr:mannose-1-phosphate guanylyltransferase [Kiritimatiellia bacterium]